MNGPAEMMICSPPAASFSKAGACAEARFRESTKSEPSLKESFASALDDYGGVPDLSGCVEFLWTL